ncbi:hypothetical protein HCN44_002447 [Aphidius gifuensis]|uniref:Glutamate-rich WD repeat-containing protein 1 n=2 Tax=Aphidius gifuensis TaxID=684658 RepID=A0A834Y2H3_APHGI|nr:hypothetical protein HCN44_002447 [Aphidius gifuensis]
MEKGEELTVDMSAYRLLHKAQTGSPCLSFDVILDDLGSSRETYPMTMYLVAGTQAPRTHINNLIVMKMTNLTGNNETKESDDESDDEDEEKMPKMSVASIKHQGCVNRVRCTQLSGKTFAASWSELGRINLWNLDEQLKAINNPTLLSAYNKKLEKQDDCVKPIFTFKGHSSEGYGIDWCKTEQGVLATGDCKGNIHIWKPSNATWNVDQRPYNSHAPQSVEDIQWSPSEKNILASCSVDKSIKIWDTRVSPQTACKLTAVDAHDADVNVISWNPRESRFIVSGGDDGVVKVWDLRQFGKNNDSAVAIFKQHTAPVTTVEWHPDEGTVFATGGSDDQIAQWDLSVEPDQDNEKDNDIGDLPPQLLFIHQGQSDVKELHWHPQCPGVMISTAHSGFNVFRTISV